MASSIPGKPEKPHLITDTVAQPSSVRTRASLEAELADDDGPKRIYRDSPDDMEMSLLRHGLNLTDLVKGAKSFDIGTRTPFSRLSHALLQWWLTLPMSTRQVKWVDPAAGYTEQTCPKLSTKSGMKLQARGLAGGRWVYTRKQLLQARVWKAHMLSLTPAQRLAAPDDAGEIDL
jgi:hypothetical protein